MKADLYSVKNNFAKVFESRFLASSEMQEKAQKSCNNLDNFTSFEGVELDHVRLK